MANKRNDHNRQETRRAKMGITTNNESMMFKDAIAASKAFVEHNNENMLASRIRQERGACGRPRGMRTAKA